MDSIDRISETADFILGNGGSGASNLIILGSGFGSVADRVRDRIAVPYTQVPHLKRPSAFAHLGNLVFGELSGKKVMIMQGRFHIYEGFEPSFTTYLVRVASRMGIRTLITTNLSGGINSSLSRGDFMIIEDHINLCGLNPLIWDRESGKEYVDMFEAYNPELIRILEQSATDLNIQVKKGVLAFLSGPNFETRAELRMLKILGADAVGWSIVPEVLEGRRCGMDIAAIACISDLSDPERFGPVDLRDLYQAGFDKAEQLFSLLSRLLEKI